MAKSIVIFTGAGAAKADGAPLQTELFRQFFAARSANPARETLRDQVGEVFRRVFTVDPRQDPECSLPTFEEALGVLELAIAREEGLLGVGDPKALGDLRRLRRQLVLALAATIARDRVASDSAHARLVDSLREGDLLNRVTFITTNYDTLLDDAIDARAVIAGRGTGSLVDYGFAGLVPVGYDRHADPHQFPVFKIHGSLNWLYCPVCDALDVTYASNGVTRLVDEPEAARCPTCETLRTPVIVPPSYYKDVSNVYLSVVWSRAYHALQEADQVIFCGYSFPDADMHVKYLVKRAQLNRDLQIRPLRAVLVNHHPDKPADTAIAEASRFTRFLGNADVWDTHLSFEDFASDPGPVILSLHQQ